MYTVASDEELTNIETVYETLPGWNCDITKCRNYEELPENAKKYLKVIEDQLSIPSK